MGYDLTTDFYVGQQLVHWQTRWAVYRVVEGARQVAAVYDSRREAAALCDLLNRALPDCLTRQATA